MDEKSTLEHLWNPAMPRQSRYERTLMYNSSIKKQAKGGPTEIEPPTTTPNVKPVEMSDWEKTGQQEIDSYKSFVAGNEDFKNNARLNAYKSKLDSALSAKNPTVWKKISGSYDPNSTVQDRISKAQGYIQDKTYPYALNEQEQRTVLGNDYEDFNKLRTDYAANVAKFGGGKYSVQGNGEQGAPVDQTAYGLRNSWAIQPPIHQWGSSYQGTPRAHMDTTISYDSTNKSYDYRYGQPKIYPAPTGTRKEGGLLKGYTSEKKPMTKSQITKQYESDRRRNSSLRGPNLVPGSASKSRSHRS